MRDYRVFVTARLSDAEVLAVLSRTTLFSALGAGELAGVAGSCLQRRVTRGQFLCYQGDPGDRLFIIATGLVKVVLTSEQGEELVLRTQGPHEVFGELAVLDQVPRSASVVAVQPTDVLMLNRPVIISLMRTYPSVMDALLVSLGRLVRQLTVQTGELAFLDLTGRLAKLLLRLTKDHGLTGRNGSPAVIDLGLTQSDLGAMVGASRPAVNRVLQALAARGVIELSGSAIVVRDVAALRRRANS
ncbi:Crp/Fnr family transcriptional regulator [Flindersiella endophytica]